MPAPHLDTAAYEKVDGRYQWLGGGEEPTPYHWETEIDWEAAKCKYYLRQKAHFDRLNGRIVVGDKWKIDERIYWYFLGILPPLVFPRAGSHFLMCEFTSGNITTHYWKDAEGKYWCEFYDVSVDPLDFKPSRY